MAVQLKPYDRSLYNTRIYRVWQGMKSRCYNPKASGYNRYGGRGIKVCSKWQTFAGFYEDMSSGYSEHLTIDRIDNSGDYTKSNCRWATYREQANNRRTSKRITYNGETRTLAQWVRTLGLKPSTVRQRLYVYKWPVEKCFEFNR